MRTLVIAALALAFSLPAGKAVAQETDTDVPQKFWIELGGFRVTTQTNLRLSGASPGDDVSFERDLDLPGNTTQAYLEGFWRLGRRHQVSLNWTSIKRDGGTITLDEEIEWGDDVFRVGAEVNGATDTDFISGAYRFAAYKNEKFEIGPAIGLGHIWITAGLTGQAGIAGGEGEEVRDISTEGTVSSITGDIGGYLYWWPGRRFLVRGDFRYIGIGLDEADAAITEGRASLIWYPWSQVGIGAQYAYTKLRYDRDLGVTELGGVLQYDGLQILVSVAF
jgi:hypothetical protein